MAEASRSAFIVANDEYADQRLRRLRAPSADARELARVLEDAEVGGFDVSLSMNEPEHVLRRRLAEFFERRGLDDVLLLHLSCHGVKDEDGRLYFATPDTQMDHLEATALPAEFVNRQMTRSRSRRIVLLLDCCYSGAFARGWMSRAGDSVDLRERFDGRGRIVLTASSAMEYSFEGDQLSGDGNPSVFTSALVQGLTTGEADRNRDGYISVDELYDYAYDQVRAATPSQTPGKWVFDVQGDFFVARSRLEPEPPAGLPAELVGATMSPLAHIRLGAVAELRALLEHPDELIVSEAREQLLAMADDDSQRVSRAAGEALAERATPADTNVGQEPAAASPLLPEAGREAVREPMRDQPSPPAAPPVTTADPQGAARPTADVGDIPDHPISPPEPVTSPPHLDPPVAAATPPPDTRRVSDEPIPPARVAWLGRLGALGLLGVLPYALAAFDQIPETAWNSFAVLSPIEGLLAGLAVWLLIDGLHAGRVPASTGAGALLVIGATIGVDAVALATFSATWLDTSLPFLMALVVFAGAVLTLIAGVTCVSAARPAARPGPLESGPLAVGVAGVVMAFVGLFMKYDGESSLSTELDEGLAQYFYTAAFACLLGVASLLTLRAWPRLAAGALLASGGVLTLHYLGVVLASAQAIGEPGETRAGGFVGVLGGLLVLVAGAYAYSAVRPDARPVPSPGA